MECERCGLCCYDAPCGCGYGFTNDEYGCDYFVIVNEKAICIGLETKNIKPEELGIGKGCGYYLKGGRFRQEYPKYAEGDLVNKIQSLEYHKKEYTL